MRKRWKQWSEGDINILKLNYFEYGVKHCAAILNRSYNSVQQQAKYLKLKTKRASLKISNRERLCSSCNKIQPIENFSQGICKGKKYTVSICKSCDYVRTRKRTNRPEIKKRINKNRRILRKKYIKNPSWKILVNSRSRISDLLRNKSKSAHTLELLGCSAEELKIHLESQFREGMTWENHGVSGWHIDHILPCASFDLTNPEEQRKCFHYTNLQPLWAKDNLSKGDKIIN